jgi:hypothetical protein
MLPPLHLSIVIRVSIYQESIHSFGKSLTNLRPLCTSKFGRVHSGNRVCSGMI